MSTRYLFLVRMDVAHDLESTFNEVYEEVRPYTYNKHYVIGERIWPKSSAGGE